jgi:hypothetical protein
MRKYLIPSIITFLLVSVIVNAQSLGISRFFRFADSPTVYKQYTTPEEFFKDGGLKDWSNVEVIDSNIGSVTGGNEYYATTTAFMQAGHRLIKTGQSALGSLVITSVGSAQLEIWNATSSTDIASTSVARIKPAAAEGTYTFDVSMPRGIVINVPTGYNGTSTITYR